MKIKILDPLVANQIAAGEVIERPASIIKECLENSLDAGATQISVEIMQGGMQSIQITDNGHGIAKEDLPNAMQRHGTSKITDTSDLSAIASLGFRGEALASICAVARVSLASTVPDAPHGWQLTAEGAETKVLETPIAHPVGTSITIRDLFFNTPARRRFLRTEKTEFNHIEEVVKRIALSRFNLAIKLTHNHRQIYQLPAATTDLLQDKRISQLCSKEFIENALKITMKATGLHLWGWIGNSQFSRSQADMQYLYINGRMVRDKLITHAIRQAYQHSVSRDGYPAYVLYLECDPQNVDVNVHPTKHEVRFHESRLIHDFVFTSLRNALEESAQQESHQENFVETHIENNKPSLAENYQPYHYQKVQPTVLAVAEQRRFYAPDDDLKTEQDETQPNEEEINFFGEPLAIVAEKFLITKNSESLGILHLQKAHQILFTKNLSQANLVSKPLLFPLTISLSEKSVAKLAEHFSKLTELGFILELLGQKQVVLRETPSVLDKVDFAKLITELASQLDHVIDQNTLIQKIAQTAAACVRRLESKALQEKLLMTLQQQLSDSELRSCYQTLEEPALARLFNMAF